VNEKKLYNVDDCENLTNSEIRDLYKKYVNPAIEQLFNSFDLGHEVIEYSEGVWIYTKNNEKILDVTGGIGVLSHGHNHPRILNTRINFQNKKKMEVNKTIFSPYTAALSHNIAKLLPGNLDYSFFCNSGAEAVEGAIKLAYKYFQGSREFILHSDIAFHGKLLGSGTITASKEVDFRFPSISNTCKFEYNNINSVIEEIKNHRKSDGTSNVYAIIIEPFSASYLRSCDDSFLKQLKSLCIENGILLIFDEIYTGWYKTGNRFNFIDSEIVPDILTTSKSLGGGKASISAYVSTGEVLKKSYGNIKSATLHTTTYNGFGEECATAIEAINIMEEENYHQKSLNIEELTKNRCKKLLEKFGNQIIDCKGKGSLHGIYFRTDSGFGKILSLLPFSMTRDKKFLSKIISASISNWLFKNYKILVLFSTTENSAILFAPSLIINATEINYFFDSLEETLEHGIWKIVSKFASKQFSSSLKE
jgi:putrescine aminotransferase